MPLVTNPSLNNILLLDEGKKDGEDLEFGHVKGLCSSLMDSCKQNKTSPVGYIGIVMLAIRLAYRLNDHANLTDFVDGSTG